MDDAQERRLCALEKAESIVKHFIPANTDIFVRAASDWHHQDDDAKKIQQITLLTLKVADLFDAYLQGSVSMSVTVGDAYDQPTASDVTTNPVSGGTTVQLKDNQQVDVTVQTADAKAFATSDTITYDVSDDTVCSVIGADDDDTHTATIVAGNVGSAVVTLTDVAAPDLAPYTIAVDVIAGDTTAITATFGDPVDQPVAAPAPTDGASGTGDGSTDGSGDVSGTGTSDTGDGSTVPSA